MSYRGASARGRSPRPRTRPRSSSHSWIARSIDACSRDCPTDAATVPFIIANMDTDEARKFHSALRRRLRDDGLRHAFAETGHPPLRMKRAPRFSRRERSETRDAPADQLGARSHSTSPAPTGRARWCWEGNGTASKDRRASALQLLVELESQAWQYGGIVLRELGVTDFLEFERLRFRALHSYLQHLGVM